MAENNTAFVNPDTGNLVTPRCRMLYPALFEVESFPNDPPEKVKKYAITLLVPKDADISVLKKAAQEAALAKFSNAKDLKLRSPFTATADNPRFAELAAEYPVMIKARSKERPGVIRADLKQEHEPSQAYGGRWCLATLQAFGYEHSGSKGVSFGLQHVQLLENDDPLGGTRVPAEMDFKPVVLAGNGVADTAAAPSNGGGAAAAVTSTDELFG